MADIARGAQALYPRSARDVVRLIALREWPKDWKYGAELIQKRSGLSRSSWVRLMRGDGPSPPSQPALIRLVAALMASPDLEAWDGTTALHPQDVVHAVIATRRRWLHRQGEKLDSLQLSSNALADQGMRLLKEDAELKRAMKKGPEYGECPHCWGPYVDPDGPVGPDAVGLPPPDFGEGEQHWMCPTWYVAGQLTEAGRAEVERRAISPPAPGDLPTRPG